MAKVTRQQIESRIKSISVNDTELFQASELSTGVGMGIFVTRQRHYNNSPYLMTQCGEYLGEYTLSEAIARMCQEAGI